MEREEYSAVSRSMLFRVLAAIAAAAAVTLFGKHSGSLLGILPTFFLALIFFFITTIKIFPSSGAWMNRRFRNYKRTRSGLPSQESPDAPEERFLDDYRRG
ncbi:MAG: hypothetical protein MK183_03665 [Verrucomicrobiales bacterium]|nr:hypothetical protein [Verrucomicrobiales bacterium]